MTLAELLISAEIDPALFGVGTKFIAQDKINCNVYPYTDKPACDFIEGMHYSYKVDDCEYSKYDGEDHINLEQLASDWTIPLSIESYTAAWNAAQNVNVKEEENVMCENVKSEWPKVMQLIWNSPKLLIVSFESETKGTCLIDEDWSERTLGISESWCSCFDATMWKPYTGTEFKLSTEATQSHSAALPDSHATLTAQDIVKQLEELKMGLNGLEASINEKKDEYSTKWAEYQDLKDQLLTLI